MNGVQLAILILAVIAILTFWSHSRWRTLAQKEGSHDES